MDRNYPRFGWGKDISVKSCGEELEVSAIVPMLDEDLHRAADPLREYRQGVKFGSQKRHGKNSPHIKFANANSDQKLTTFVHHFGPVVVRSSRTKEVTTFSGPSQQWIVARQNLSELRNEQRAYRAALTLISGLQRGKGI